MDSLKILRDAIRLLINETIQEGNLDASWSASPLAITRPDDEECTCESDEELEEFGGGYGRPCGC